MNTTTLPALFRLPEVESSFAASDRWADEQVAKGRALDDVLAGDGHSDLFWLNKNVLRRFSRAVEASFS